MKKQRGILKNKKGSYLIEATMSLPVFIIAMIAICLIVEIISICEAISFETVKTVRDIDLYSYQVKTMTPIEKLAIKEQISNASDKLTDFEIKRLRYLYRSNGIDDLIALDTEANFSVINTIGIGGKITFTESLLTRGFTGKFMDGKPLGADEFESNVKSTKVVIFPKYGIRYHIPNCRYVTQKYSGDSYHIEMEKEDAKRKGYTPCTVCIGVEREQ